MARFIAAVVVSTLLLLSASTVSAADAISPDNANLNKARAVQNNADALRDEMTQKMLGLEEEYHKRQVPVFKERNEALAHLDGFWLRVIENHPSHTTWFRGSDREIMTHLKDISIEDTHPEGSFATQAHNFKITFTFGPNPFFSDSQLWRSVKPGDEPAQVSKINWAAGQAPKEPSFFHFFENPPADESSTTFLDAHALNDITHVLRYELWPNPFQFYDIPSFEEQANNNMYGGEEPSPDSYAEEVPSTNEDEIHPVHEEALGHGAEVENPAPAAEAETGRDL